MIFCNNIDRLVFTFSHLKPVMFMNVVAEAAYERFFVLAFVWDKMVL